MRHSTVLVVVLEDTLKPEGIVVMVDDWHSGNYLLLVRIFQDRHRLGPSTAFGFYWVSIAERVQVQIIFSLLRHDLNTPRVETRSIFVPTSLCQNA